MTAASKKAGRPRKSRRLRLPIASGANAEVQFSPSGEDWERIERAYGRALTPDNRSEIAGFIDKYFLWQPSEAMAPFANDAYDYLNQLEKTANTFWRVLLERSHIPMTGSGDQAHIAQRDSIRGVGIVYVQSHVGRFIRQFRGGKDWKGLLDMMQACMPAIMATRQYLDEQAKFGFVEGRSWNELVWNLSEFAKSRGLPNGVSKSDDPAKASPFVAFVRELQGAFPERFRRHGSTNAALAEAITVARREIRRAFALQAAQKANSSAVAN
jgi:hypothetical protein